MNSLDTDMYNVCMQKCSGEVPMYQSSMECLPPFASTTWFYIELHCIIKRSKRHSALIKMVMDEGIGRDLGGFVGWTEKIQGEDGL